MKKNPGSETRRTLLRRLASPLAMACLAPLATAAAPGDEPKQKDPKQKDKEKQPVSDTLIKVTTFSELGATVRGARVRLLPADKDGNPIKGKSQDGQTNGMGEFPFYVPKTEAQYVLRAEAKGFETTDKVVSVRGEDQVDIFLQMPQKK